MYSKNRFAQHINGCDMLRQLIELRENALEGIDKRKYLSYYQRELMLVEQLKVVYDKLIYVTDYPLFANIMEFLEQLKTEEVNGLTIQYPLRPHINGFSNFAQLNLLPYVN